MYEPSTNNHNNILREWDVVDSCVLPYTCPKHEEVEDRTRLFSRFLRIQVKYKSSSIN